MSKRGVDHVEPAQEPVEDRPGDGLVLGVGDDDGEGRAEAEALARRRAVAQAPALEATDPSGEQLVVGRALVGGGLERLKHGEHVVVVRLLRVV